MPLRVAFCGASGTGKSTLADYVAQRYGLSVNPVGSRTVAQAMGFQSPYDVDKAGRRAEFQARLMTEKRVWEAAHDSFVTDRTTLDNLAYLALHDVSAIDVPTISQASYGMLRYTHVFYCPAEVFCEPGNDPARVKDAAYHRVYDAMLNGLITKHMARKEQRLYVLDEASLGWRTRMVCHWLDRDA